MFKIEIMPNHVKSSVIISGDKKELEKLSVYVSSENSVFDFSKIVTPPNDPAYNDLPSQPAARQSPNWWMTWNCKYWGTKWNCYEISQGLTVDMLKAYKIGILPIKLNEEQNKVFSLLAGNDKSLLLGLGFMKSVSMPPEFEFLKKELIVYSFETAWSMPNPIFKALSYAFPNLEFTVLYADEDIGSNCGISTYTGGVCVDVFESISENKDYEKENFQEFACIMNGYDYEEYKDRI